jgi:hypothetical protein
VGLLSDYANISYGIEVLAHRPGILKRNRQVGQHFPVLHVATKEQVEDTQRLKQGWGGSWTTLEETKMIRRGIIGKYATVYAQVCICISNVSLPFLKTS